MTAARASRFTWIDLLAVVVCLLILWDLVVPAAWLSLFLGWVFFLARVIPQLHPDPATLWTGVVSLAGATIALHLLLRRFSGRPLRWGTSLALLGLVGLSFAAGLAVVGIRQQVGWLFEQHW